MRLLDANVSIYADNLRAEQHELTRSWLGRALRGPESLVLPWISALAYLRVVTNPRAMPEPLSLSEAFDLLGRLLSSSAVLVGEPDRRHLERVEQLLRATGVDGNLVTAAHLAAIALQYDATVVSYDNDFARFPGVRWERPKPNQPSYRPPSASGRSLRVRGPRDREP